MSTMPPEPSVAERRHQRAFAHSEPSVGTLLRRPRDAVERHMQEGLLRAGHPFHRAHMAVFRHLDHAGTRVTVLAERCAVTKQTMVHLVDELQRRGYLERVPDLDDGRAKTVRMTARGWEVHELGHRLVADLDRVWARRLGRARYAQLKQLLNVLDASLDAPEH
jgi:DNA-binding MarR family transcriptional regulator